MNTRKVLRIISKTILSVISKISVLQFILIGNGQTRKKIDQLYQDLKLDNIIFIDRVDNSQIINYIKLSSFCLGIFGNTDKAKRVIANKVLECWLVKELLLLAGTR